MESNEIIKKKLYDKSIHLNKKNEHKVRACVLVRGVCVSLWKAIKLFHQFGHT